MKTTKSSGWWTALLLVVAGCGSSVDPKLVAEWRTRFALVEEPAEASGLLDLPEVMQQAKEKEIVLVGVIGGVPDPWTKNKASFIITDPALLTVEDDAKSKHHDQPGHDPATCPFCSKHQAEPDALALVEFADATGRVLPIDARQLFDVKSQQIVVVKGTARHDASGHWVVAADGLYVRR